MLQSEIAGTRPGKSRVALLGSEKLGVCSGLFVELRIMLCNTRTVPKQ
jgi:hypothetical protein